MLKHAAICDRLCMFSGTWLIKLFHWHYSVFVCHIEIMPPARKKSRLDELVSLRARLPFISQSALSAILKIATTEGLPKITTRRGVRQARDNFARITTPHGPLHTHIDVTDSVTIEVQNPFAVFWYACKTSASFSSLVAATLASHPSSPASQWSLVLYCDEVSPGNQLAYTHDRKAWAVYWSFGEFGSHLCQEACLNSNTNSNNNNNNNINNNIENNVITVITRIVMPATPNIAVMTHNNNVQIY